MSKRKKAPGDSIHAYEGMMVYYTPDPESHIKPVTRSRPFCIPGMVVRICDEHGTVNLRLFLDGSHDCPDFHSLQDTRWTEWVQNVVYDPDSKEPNSWRQIVPKQSHQEPLAEALEHKAEEEGSPLLAPKEIDEMAGEKKG